MKSGINILLVSIFCVGLSGCYDSAVRFWNGRAHMSRNESEAYDKCFEELRSLSRPKNEYIGSKEMQDWLGNVYIPARNECLRRKGF